MCGLPSQADMFNRATHVSQGANSRLRRSRRALPFVPQGNGSAGPEYLPRRLPATPVCAAFNFPFWQCLQGRGSMLCLASQMASIFRVERCLAEIA